VGCGSPWTIPLSPEMAKQVATGHLRPVDGVASWTWEAGDKSLVVSPRFEADTVNRVGTHRAHAG
jgi:hypothetical protein